MPRFGQRREPSVEQPPASPPSGPPEPSAAERLAALVAEQNEIHATLADHREQRAALLKQDGSLGEVRALEGESGELRLRLEQLALRLPDLEREIEQERREEWERAWQTHVPVLAQAEAELVAAVQTFFAALGQANAAHGRAAGFGGRVTAEFVRPPPPGIYNDWALREFLKAVERRQRPTTAPAPTLDMLVETPLHIPPAARFAPRRVPYQLVEEISPIAPMRRVRLLHTVRASNLNIGHARLKAGDEMEFPARAAFLLTYSGVGVYTDIETAETATAAA